MWVTLEKLEKPKKQKQYYMPTIQKIKTTFLPYIKRLKISIDPFV